MMAVKPKHVEAN